MPWYPVKLSRPIPVFDGAETVLAIPVPGGAAFTRKQLDEFSEWVKRPQIGMKGLAYIRYNEDGILKSRRLLS